MGSTSRTEQLPCLRDPCYGIWVQIQKDYLKKNINALQNLITNKLLCTKYKLIDDYDMTGKCIFCKYLD